MGDNLNLKWDHYSDQPEVIKDRDLKKRMYKQARWDTLKLFVSNLVIYPFCLLNFWMFPVKSIKPETSSFFGLSINLDKNPNQTFDLVDDLGAKNILIRMPLSDIDNIQQYVNFAKRFSNRNILINILQDRRHIENLELSRQSLDQVFTLFSPLTNRFQIGNAINRKKWAVFSMDEYLRFYKVAYDLRNQHFPNLKLLGSSVIDFEYYFSIRTLFNGYKIRFDQFSSLLYVDRRGAPENTQMGLNLVGKLKLMQAMLRLSRKSSNEIVITETNWPITNTYPYAPTSENDCVDLETQADFLVRYYLLALGSGVVKNVYWHQLIAPGYGLIDNRESELIKYPSYSAFKNMLFQLQDTKFCNFSISGGIYKAKFIEEANSIKTKTIEVFWLNNSPATHETISVNIDTEYQQAISRNGAVIKGNSFDVSGSPIYLITGYQR